MKKKLLALLLTIAVILTSTITVFADGSNFGITNGTPESDNDMNHGYITVDETAAEGETVTITVNPADGYQLKSLTATPVAPTISTIADVLATVEEFPEGKQETGSSPEPIGEAWSCGSCCAFEMSGALILKASSGSYIWVSLTTQVTKEKKLLHRIAN